MFQTQRLLCIPVEEKHLNALIIGEHEFERLFNYKLEAGYLETPEVLPAFLSLIKIDNPDFMWLTYFILSKENNRIIGMGGFKNIPDDNGIVEFGYGISQSYRNNGYATEFSTALIKQAFKYPNVNSVIAFTAPEINASNKVLIKCGLTKTGETIDPNDGLVWKWSVDRVNFKP